MSDEMSDEMSERIKDIAEFTVMNDDSEQAIFITRMRNLSERMTDGWQIGCPMRWRNCRQEVYKKPPHKLDRLVGRWLVLAVAITSFLPSTV